MSEPKKYNKGEWSELYAFLYLLGHGKLYAADEQLNKIEDMFFPIIKIIREEKIGDIYEYHIGEKIKICLNDTYVLELPAGDFLIEAKSLLSGILKNEVDSRTKMFMDRIYVNNLKAPSKDKSDIVMQLHDIKTGFEEIVGFSIKSKLGSLPTLLNPSSATNFIYRISGDTDVIKNIKSNLVNIQGTVKPNSENKSFKIKDIFTNMTAYGGKLEFYSLDERFNRNLMMIDSQMPKLIAELLVAYYSGAAKSSVLDILGTIEHNDCLKLGAKGNKHFYSHKVKEFLCSSALGMVPAKEWSGVDDATGGYIVVKKDGDIVAYHIYNRDKFKSYLLTNTKLDAPQRFDSKPPSKKKGYDYGYIYESCGELFMKLSLQIRFK